MTGAVLEARLRRALRRRERPAVLVLVALLLALAILGGVRPLRDTALDQVQRVVRYWDNRWTRRVEQGEALVAAGRLEEAAVYLEALDRDFPAPRFEYGRGVERERVLKALLATYRAQERKRRSLDTVARLAAFDPRAFANHVLQAETALQFQEPDLARQAFGRALAIQPSHEPSVAGVARLAYESGAFGEVVTVYEAYLDAFQVATLEVGLDDATAPLRVPVDGRFHEVEAVLERPADPAAELRLATGQFGFELDELVIEPPLRIGVEGRPPALRLGPDAAWQPRNLSPGPGHTLRPSGEAPALRLAPLPLPDGASRLRVRLRLFKPVGAELWDQVVRSYRNRLDWDGLAAAQARTLPPGDEAGT